MPRSRVRRLKLLLAPTAGALLVSGSLAQTPLPTEDVPAPATTDSSAPAADHSGAPADAPTTASRPIEFTKPEISNPELYKKSLEAAVQTIHQFRLTNDEEAQRRVNRIGYELASKSDFDRYPFTFAVVDMPIPNAFALPAGQIFVTKGMLDLELDDQMLAALIGHEISHVTEQHFLHMRRRATLLNVLTQLLTVGAIAATANDNRDVYQGPGGLWTREPSKTADLIQGAQATSLVMSELLLRSYSRENEDQADEEGQRLAALAGYDPIGARDLMQRMRSLIPDSRAYGYWRTHPFFEERVRAAEARAATLTIQPPPDQRDVDAYRAATQKVLLDAIDQQLTKEPELVEPVKQWALLAWPTGEASDHLRLESLDAMRDAELEKKPLARKYGDLIAAYRKQQQDVTDLDPSSPLIEQLETEITSLQEQVDELYPQALAVLDGGVFETAFLECFAQNFPDSPRTEEVALDLGVAYSRLGRETDAVSHFLRAFDQDGATGASAARGLRALAPRLRELSALQELVDQQRDPELAALATKRLDELSDSYEDIANGARYLEKYGDEQPAEQVSDRLNKLADKLYQEMVIYQQIGDVAKAVDRASKILEHAPLSPAAERLGKQLEETDLFG